MIYAHVGPDDPIRQGDIFRSVPRVDISLTQLVAISKESPVQTAWKDALKDDSLCEPPSEHNPSPLIRAILPIASVDAIILSQDCDAARDEELSLCEIGLLPSVWSQAKQAKGAKWYAEMLTRQGSEQLKIFYLPEEIAENRIVGFDSKMAADFSSIFQLRRAELESLKEFRTGRLNDEAYAHFREKLSEYFRRYPVDPWYALNTEEFSLYSSKQQEPVKPRPYQA